MEHVESKEANSPLGKIGNKIEGLDFNSGVFYGNFETSDEPATSVGTINDDIIRGGSNQ